MDAHAHSLYVCVELYWSTISKALLNNKFKISNLIGCAQFSGTEMSHMHGLE